MGRRRNVRKKHVWPYILVFFALLVTVSYFFVKYEFRITTINISGSDKYTYDELYDYIFEGRNDKNLILYQYSDKKAKPVDIPFISKVNVAIKWPHTIDVTVYEKSITGYINYKGSNMYFDKDGVVVESSNEVFDNVPLVTGLDFDSIVMYSKLKVEDDSVFKALHDISQYIDKYSLSIDRINIRKDGGFELIFGDVTVLLGEDDEYMSDKIYELSCMKKNLEGLNGTLHLEKFTGDTSYILFKQNEDTNDK